MNFNSLRYRIEVTFKYKRTTFTLIKRNLKLDYEDSKDFFAVREIKYMFYDELKDKKILDLEKAEILEVKITQTENSNPNIIFEVNRENIFIYRKDCEIFSEEIDASIKVTLGKLIIDILNDRTIYHHKITIVDKMSQESVEPFTTTTDFFKNHYEYFYKYKFITISIERSINGKIISTYEKDIELNELANIENILINKNIKANSNKPIEGLFKSGLEKKGLTSEIKNISRENYFDIRSDIFTLVNNPKEVYTKVLTNYNIDCDYKVNKKEVRGKIRYQATILTNGIGKAKVLRYATNPYSCTYNVKAKVTYFKTLNGRGDYRTSTISVPMTFSYDPRKLVYIDSLTQNFGIIDIIPIQSITSRSVYEIIKNEVDRTITGASDVNIHSFKIEDVVNKVGNTVVSDQNLLPFIENVNNNANISGPVKCIIKPAEIYFGYKLFTKEVQQGTNTFISNAEINAIPLYDVNGKRYTGSSTPVSKAFFVGSSDNVSLNVGINGEVSSNIKGGDVVNGEVTLNLDNKSETVDLKRFINDKVRKQLNVKCTATVNITCLEDCYINGAILRRNNTKVLNLDLKKDGLVFGVAGSIVTVSESKHKRLPENDELFTAEINGVEATYHTALKGKMDYSRKQEAFNLPSGAFDIRYTLNIVDVIPSGATISKTITTTTNHETYSMDLRLSSNYMSKIDNEVPEKISSQNFKGYHIGYNLNKTITLRLDKPANSNNICGIFLTSNNPNVLLEYPRRVDFGGRNYAYIDVVATSTIHLNNRWHLETDSSYLYLDEVEYYIFNKYYLLNVNSENKIIAPFIDNNEPICVENNGVNLTRIVSTESDGITIKEEFKKQNSNGYYGLKYANPKIEKVMDLEGNEIPYTLLNYVVVIPNDYKGCVVYYKVENSFDFKKENNKTIITINSENSGACKVYFNTNKKIEHDINLNPLNNIVDKGYIFIPTQQEKPFKCNVYINDYISVNEVIIEILDKYSNAIEENIGANIYINGIRVRAAKSDPKYYTDNNGVIRFSTATNIKTLEIEVDGVIFKVSRSECNG